MTTASSSTGPRIGLGFLALVLCAYAWGLFGGFLFDDFPAIVQNPALRNLDSSPSHWLYLALSSNSGELRRPISLLSFGVDYALFGLSPLAFKATNLFIHLLNGGLFFLLAKKLAGQLAYRPSADNRDRCARIAAIATALWVAHPLHVSNVLYIVQRMNLLSTFFCLLGLLAYAEGRVRLARNQSGIVLAIGGLCLAALLAVLSKENGALIFAYAFVIECFCFRFAAPRRLQHTVLRAFFVLTLALPIAAFAFYLAIHPQWLTDRYAGRAFTLAERLMSESRILTDYVTWTLLPLPQWMGIFHDDFVKSTGLWQPPSTLFCVAFWAVVVVAAILMRRKAAGIAFAIAWFLVGQSMESTILPLELVFDHRNYLPSAGLILGLACWLVPRLKSRLPATIARGISAAVVVVFLGITATRAYDWSSELRLAQSEVAHHPLSSRAQYEMGRQLIFTGSADGKRRQAEDEALPYFNRARALDASEVFGTSSALLIEGRDGKEIPPALVDELARRIGSVLQPHINPFNVVVKAASQGSIRLSAEQVEKLVTAALDNPVFPPTMRASVLSGYAHYQFQRLNDPQAAVSLSLAAAAEDPKNPLFQIDIVQIAIAIADKRKALQHLRLASELDTIEQYSEALEKLAKQVRQMKDEE